MASLNTEDILEQLKQLRQDLQQLHVELRTLRESKEMSLQMEELVKQSQPPDAQFAEEEKGMLCNESTLAPCLEIANTTSFL